MDSRSPALALHRESRKVHCEATVSDHTQFPGASAWEQLLMAALRPECRQLLGTKQQQQQDIVLAQYWYQSINELVLKIAYNPGKVRSCKRFIGFSHSSRCENAHATLRSACARSNQRHVKHGLRLSEQPRIVNMSTVSLSALHVNPRAK